MRRRRASLESLSRAPWPVLLVAAVLLSAPYAAQAQTCATPGKDGAATLTGVINTYHPGVSASGTSITVGPSRFGGATTPISTGDLLLVIQMQGADIYSANDDSRYGDGVSGDPGSGWTTANFSGAYEYVVATSSIPLSGGTLSIRSTGTGGALLYTYTDADASSTQGQRRFQVVRVPQYSTATLTSGLTAARWDGETGGILAFDVAGALNLGSATVNLSGMGFRGGGSRQLGGDTTGTASDNDYRSNSSLNVHGSKGEGIAGTPRYVYNELTNTIDDTGVEGYPNGSHGRGSPGTAGGGGTDSDPDDNQENSGGGGGSNGGFGGKGGNTWQANSGMGGFGALAFPASITRIVMGGGGGGGTKNNSDGLTAASTGAAGGGIVMIRSASLSGTGTINVNGSNASDITLNDGGGGGGAGGSVVVITGSGLAGLTVNARGGDGGDAWRTQSPGGTPGERHGPGGGGGGGAILLSGTGASTSVTGGASGVTTTALDTYGTTASGNGVVSTGATAASVPGIRRGAQCLPSLTTTKTTSTPNVTNSPSGTTATYTITVTNAANLGSAIQLNISDALPTNFTYASTSSVAATLGATRDSTVNPTVGATNPSWGVFTIPGGGQVRIIFTVNISRSVITGTYQNPATATYLDPVRTLANPTNTVSSNYNSASSTGENVTVTSRADMTIAKSHTGNFTQGQTNATYTLTVTNSGSGQTSGVVTVTDTLPASLTPTGWSSTGGWSCNIAAQVVTCTRSDALVAPSSYPAINITVTVSTTAPASVTNTASVSGGGETNTSNNSASDPTTITPLADLTITKSHTGNFMRGASHTYTITVTNSGAAATSGSVTVTDTLPAGLTPTPWSGNGWACGISSQTVTCTRSTVLNAGAGYPDISIPVTVAQNAAASLTNTATVSGGGQVNTANDSASDPTNIVSSSDLSLTKVTNSSGNGVGTNATFTVTLTNTGPTNATGVAVLDQLPAGLTYISSTPSTGSYNSGTGIWTVGNVASGASPTLQIVARIDVVGALTNTAQVSASNQPDPDSTPNNSNATEDDQASSGLTTSPPNVVLCKTVQGEACPPVNPLNLPPGSDITYVITYTNTGGSIAQNFVITDPSLPPISTLKLNDYTYFKVGSIQNTLPAGMSVTDIKYSNNAGATWTYTPSSGGGGAPAGYDANVTHLQIIYGGQLNPGSTGNVSFTVRIR
jgi:uncharacterized repeat protein (TIGR01451 family)/fimbrial isopeptide formation D2 family protein